MAAVILETVIKTNPVGRWYLEIRDSEEQRTEICLDLEIFHLKKIVLILCFILVVNY